MSYLGVAVLRREVEGGGAIPRRGFGGCSCRVRLLITEGEMLTRLVREYTCLLLRHTRLLPRHTRVRREVEGRGAVFRRRLGGRACRVRLRISVQVYVNDFCSRPRRARPDTVLTVFRVFRVDLWDVGFRVCGSGPRGRGGWRRFSSPPRRARLQSSIENQCSSLRK